MLSVVLPPVNNVTFGKDQMVSHTLKGVFIEKPSLPKYVAIYDCKTVLAYMDSLPDNNELLLELLTIKLCTLMCILSGKRAQTICALRLDAHVSDEDSFTFYIRKRLKTTTPSFHQEPLVFVVYPHNQKLCVVNCLKEYLDRNTSSGKTLKMVNS